MGRMNEPLAASPSKQNMRTYAADATFQLDLFGQLRTGYRGSARPVVIYGIAQKRVLTLVSDVASDYFALLALDLQLQIARDTVKTQEDARQN